MGGDRSKVRLTEGSRVRVPWGSGRTDDGSMVAKLRCQFARVVKGVDLRSTAGNCAWARAPQLTFVNGHVDHPVCRTF